MHRSLTSLGMFIVAMAGSAFPARGQQEITESDSVQLLEEVIVKAYHSNRPISEVPAAIALVGARDLNRFSNTSLLPAANAVPGVRMEERSPGSYRFSIRGSLLRSPFGVRNVKFYWRGMPLTDGGGNTYLNLLDFSSVKSMEIVKGPGASLYGAGTGGVVLLEPPNPGSTASSNFSVQAGSYGMWRYQGEANIGSLGKSSLAMRAGYLTAQGYREQTNMNRLVGQIDWDYAISTRTSLSTGILATRLYYETPGALTRAQFESDPRQARPASPVLPGAVEQMAAVENQTLYVTSVLEHDWNDKWSSRAGLFGSTTSFQNPTIRNFEERDETNFGGRTETQVHVADGAVKTKITFGGEFQDFYSPLAVYDNNLGTKGTLQTDDRLKSTSGLIFAQADLDFPYNFYLTVGGSANFLKYRFTRVNATPEVRQERAFEPGFFPRLALLKKLTDYISLYATVSNGFSAPSLAEVRPSTGAFNNSLNPERGTNIELGTRVSLFARQFHVNLSAYDFQLDETIVIQRAADGAEYFVNAGNTSQRGLEGTVVWDPALSGKRIRDFRLWLSYTYNDYNFKNYINDGTDYSGNLITGVSPDVVVSGLDITLGKGWYTNITFNYTDHIPLNDANTEFASDYSLLGARVGKAQKFKKIEIEFFAGVDNALDERYSLGNDLNAVGGRYYNAAAGRNYFGGIRIFPGGR